MSSKTIARDSISGHHQHVDIADGTHSVSEINNRTAERLEALKAAIAADSDKAGETTLDHPAYGNALSLMPRPGDDGKGGERCGVSVAPGEQSKKPAPRDNSKVSR